MSGSAAVNDRVSVLSLLWNHMTEDSDVREIAALLEDEYAHTILIHTSTQEMSAPELSDACEASVSTIHRRISAALVRSTD